MITERVPKRNAAPTAQKGMVRPLRLFLHQRTVKVWSAIACSIHCISQTVREMKDDGTYEDDEGHGYSAYLTQCAYMRWLRLVKCTITQR